MLGRSHDRSRVVPRARFAVLASIIAVLSLGSAARAQAPFAGAWGSSGAGPGQFANPFGIALDGAGFVYVTDLANHRVQKFTADGVFVTAWGSQGSGPGQFEGPLGIAWSPAGEILVADHANHRVQRFTTNGAHLGTFGGAGGDPGEMRYPVAVAVDEDGLVYVTESENHRVQVFSATGAFVRGWGSFGAGPGQMVRPYGVEVGDGQVFVAEHGAHTVTTNGEGVGDRVQRFTTMGALELAWGSAGSGEGQFRKAEGLALDGTGTIYVADTDNDRVQRFTRDGQFLAAWGGTGNGEGRFLRPSDVAVGADGTIYVVDSGNDRIQRFGAPAPADHRPTIAGVRDVPDDDGGWVHVLWTPSDLDAPPLRAITGYRVWRRIATDAAAALAAARPAAAAEWTADGRRVTARTVAGATTFWEAIATVPAERLEGYGVTASTPRDSTRRDPAWTAFFVSALTADPFVVYASAVDSGYSVDDHAPGPPFAPEVHPTAEGARVSWRANREHDLSGYRLYRGAAPDFTPSAEHLIAAPKDTSHVDEATAGAAFYAVSAVDVNGNESEITRAVVTVGIDPSPPGLALAAPTPNPSRGDAVRMSWTLARPDDATLEIVDLQGRAVRVLARGTATAGSHEASWTGNDDAGRRLPAGVYFARLRAEGRERVRRVVWMP